MTEDLPIVAVVGRPNVGKSTLVNRILRRRAAVVEDVPGVTRDRVTYEAEWAGRRFTLIDTGGWDPGATGLMAGVAQQAELAVGLADVVLFVVDVQVGITDTEDEVVRILQRSGKPVVLAANKADDFRGESAAHELWGLGLGEPFGVSAVHGRGTGELLDSVLEALPRAPKANEEEPGGPRRIAFVGKPNVGKSSLLNQLAGEPRAVVDEVGGTTVDPVDETVELGGKPWRVIDTAGIRRRVRDASGHEYYASLRTQAAIERAEAAVVLIDAGEPLSEQDLRIISMVADSGRALVLALNKWDLVDSERRRWLEKELDRQLVQVRWAPRVNMSARTGWHMNRIVGAAERALAGWETRVSTADLNAFLGRLVSSHPHPVRGGKQPKILFGTQPQVGPPKFLLFTSGPLDDGYRRFVERRLREEYGFEGSPIRITLKVREKARERRGGKKK